MNGATAVYDQNTDARFQAQVATGRVRCKISQVTLSGHVQCAVRVILSIGSRSVHLTTSVPHFINFDYIYVNLLCHSNSFYIIHFRDMFEEL